MSSRFSLGLALSLPILTLLGGSAVSSAADPEPQVETARLKADQLVAEADHREWYALEEERESLLRQALAVDPNHAAARWRLGYVRLNGEWVEADRAPEQFAKHPRLAAYEELRDKSADTVAGHWRMAAWARAQALPEMEGAHLRRITQLAPDHAAARARLGEVKVNDDWIPQSAFWRAAQDRERLGAALQRFAPLVRRLLDLPDNEETAVEAAELQEQLGSLDAVPAVEFLLGYGPPAEALLATRILAGVNDHAASQALARMAVFAPHLEVRLACGQELQHRPLHDFAPMLLREMSTPIESRVAAFTNNGHMFVRHVMLREEKDQQHWEVLDSVVIRRGAPLSAREDVRVGNAAEALMAESMRRMLVSQARNLESQRQLQNQWITAVNRRICEALAGATGELWTTPQQWWDWWNEQNQTVLVSKTPSVNYNRQVNSYSEPSREMLATGISGGVSHECFIAGTPVWTHRGPRPIEKIRVGDLVLSQHPDTGELAYRPVVGTTERPPEALVRIHTSAGAVEGTGGHPLWVVGQGWKMMSEIRSGMLLHGVDGGSLVSRTELGGFATTYNLVVEGAPTYFVGAERLLAHDNTERGPCSTIVPGGVRDRD